MLKKGTSGTVTVFMRSSLDHLTAISGLTPTVSISKAGSPFTIVSRTVTSLGDGVYAIDLLASDTDTIGELTILVTDTFNLADNSLVVTSVEIGDALTKGEFLALS
jgi:hypothetical protein